MKNSGVPFNFLLWFSRIVIRLEPNWPYLELLKRTFLPILSFVYPAPIRFPSPPEKPPAGKGVVWKSGSLNHIFGFLKSLHGANLAWKRNQKGFWRGYAYSGLEKHRTNQDSNPSVFEPSFTGFSQGSLKEPWKFYTVRCPHRTLNSMHLQV